MRYQVRIDGQLYESSPSLEEAVRLYNTMDGTCLKQYLSHEKTLVRIDGDKEEVLKKGKIKSKMLGLHL